MKRVFPKYPQTRPAPRQDAPEPALEAEPKGKTAPESEAQPTPPPEPPTATPEPPQAPERTAQGRRSFGALGMLRSRHRQSVERSRRNGKEEEA